MTMTIQDDTIGYPRAAWQYWDTNQGAPVPGVIAPFVDSYFGGSELMWGKAAAATTMGTVCTWDGTFTMTAVTNTANLGRPVCVAIGTMPINTYGWFALAGNFPLAATASVAAGSPVGITGAGTIGANTAGKQIVNATSVYASTANVVKANTQTTLNSTVLQVPNADGIFVGCVPSGTGIPAATVTQINPNGKEVTISAAATATGAVSVTFTYTGFVVCSIDRPSAQGAIT